MSLKKSYSRKISAKEANDDFILILKNYLSFFPQLGKAFMITGDGFSSEVRVESYPCTCRGPNLPHEHYFIKWEGLKPGNKLEIKKNPSKNNEYYLTIMK